MKGIYNYNLYNNYNYYLRLLFIIKKGYYIMFNWNTLNKEVKRNLEEIVPGYVKYMSNHRAYTGIDYYISFILLKDNMEKINESLGKYFKTYTRLQCSLYPDNNNILEKQLLITIEIYPGNQLSQNEYTIIKEFVENKLGFEEFNIMSVANIIEPEYKIIIRSDKLTQLFNKVKDKLEQKINSSYNPINNRNIDNYKCLMNIIFDHTTTF